MLVRVIFYIFRVWSRTRLELNHFKTIFTWKLLQNAKKKQSGAGPRQKPPSSKEGDESEDTSNLDLPNIWPVKRQDWANHQFNEHSALKVIDSGESGYDFFVNIDNIHLLTELKSNTDLDSKLLEARYKYGMALIGLALLHEGAAAEKANEDVEEDVFQKILDITKMISPILLPMISSLGSLELDEPEVLETAGA